MASREKVGWISSTVVVFSIALLISLMLHAGPIWTALGVLKQWWESEDALARTSAPVEIEFAGAEAAEPDRERPQAPEAPPPPDAVESGVPPTPETEAAPPRASRAAPQPEPRRDQDDPEEQAALQEVQPPPQTVEQRQAITQRSHDPSVPPPPDARFIARENRRVEEEMQARTRSYVEDDAHPTPGPQRESSDSREEGNDREQETADLREREGDDSRRTTRAEAREQRPDSQERMRRAIAAGDQREQGETRPEEAGAPGDQRIAGERGGARTTGGGAERAREPRMVRDPMGSFVIAERPIGTGPGEGGGEARPSAGSDDLGRGNTAGRPGAGRRGRHGRGLGAGDRGPPFRVTWGVLEDTYGEEALREEREAYAEERRSRVRGSNRRAEDWRQFRAAIENFVPNVRPGNQTALNAAASPFADYLAEVHRRIHREFADRFLGGLPAGGTSPFADRTLMTKLEIILNRDGTVHRIGVVRTSGFLPYDYGAFAAVMRGQPYPEPPGQILSGDGRVYFHWGFYRNERQCGTFNAEPYILPHPPGSPRPGRGPLQDRPEYDTVIPRDAVPAGDGSGLPQPGRGGSGDDGEEPPSDAPREEPATPPREEDVPVPGGGGVLG